MSFHSNSIGFESVNQTGYPPPVPPSYAQAAHHPPGPQPYQQPHNNYAGYTPAQQPPPHPMQYPPQIQEYPHTYPAAAVPYNAPVPEPWGGYPLTTSSAALPYPVQPASFGTSPYSAQPTFSGYGAGAGYASASYAPAPQPPPASYATSQYPLAQAYPAVQQSFACGYQQDPTTGVYPASAYSQVTGTIKPFLSFNAEADSKVLRTAMKGLGTDEQALINVIGRRSNAQRQQLKLMYKTMYGRDLVNDLSSELSFRFKQTMLALMMAPCDYDASELHKAMKGLGTNELTLVEILCSRSNSQIVGIKTAYHNMYRRELEKDLVGDTSGHFRRFLVSHVMANRREDGYVDIERARREAMELYQAGEARLGTDESKFNQILCTQSHAQLRATFDEYQRIAHRSIIQSLIREMSGDLLMGMLTVVNIAINPHKYFAEGLYLAMKGAGTNDDTLIRIIVSRSEIDLVQIKHEFQRQYGQSLEAFVQGDTSGDYRKILLTVLNGL